MESVVKGRLEQPVSWAVTTPSQAIEPAAMDLPSYRLATTVASNWIPLAPHRLPGTADSVLVGGSDLRIPDEEVPREGIRLTTQVLFARWINSHAVLWPSHRKQPGRGEGSSGLNFDVLR